MAAASQSYDEALPVAELAPLVSSTWVQRVDPAGAAYAHRSVPTGGVELVCRSGHEPRLIGPRTGPTVDVLAPGTTVHGLRLRPGALPALLRMPAGELLDADVPAADVLALAPDTGERVDAAGSPAAALAVLQGAVAAARRGRGAPDPLVGEVVRRLHWRAEDVALLGPSLHISQRQLRRRCHAAVGLAPKTLHRILRFQQFLALAQHAMAQGRAPTGDGLAALAAEAGYADQAHLSRECRRLTGLTPTGFLAGAVQTCACGHDHAASYTSLLRLRPGGAAAV
jgi:AraC-like DNA-binding protein